MSRNDLTPTTAEPAAPVALLGRTYGYLRVSTDRQALSPEVQRQIITETARRFGREIDTWFQDAPTQNADGSWNDAQSGSIPLPERRAGRELCARLKRDDLVIVAKVDRAFRKLSDCVIMLDRWERVGVNLILCDFPMLSDLSNPFQKAFIQFVAIFGEIERKLTAQRTREALSLRKRKGHAFNQHPGFGFQWEKRWDATQKKYVKVKVTNHDERNVMREIVKWKLDGHTWDHIVDHLNYSLKLKTKNGTEWSRSRVIRAFRAELKLQQEQCN